MGARGARAQRVGPRLGGVLRRIRQRIRQALQLGGRGAYLERGRSLHLREHVGRFRELALALQDLAPTKRAFVKAFVLGIFPDEVLDRGGEHSARLRSRLLAVHPLGGAELQIRRLGRERRVRRRVQVRAKFALGLRVAVEAEVAHPESVMRGRGILP